MQLKVNVSASSFDERYQMAYIHCRDVTTGYCFSLSRFPNSEEIEVMVLDQINTKVADLKVRFDGSIIYVELNPSEARRLDGERQYEIELMPQEGRRPDVTAALKKIFEGKTGLQGFGCD